MEQLLFWRTWKPADKYLYLFSLILVALTLLWFVVSYVVGIDAVINWEVEKNSQPVNFVVDTFQKFLVDFQYDADAYSIVQSYKASDIQLNITANYLFLAAVIVGFIFLITVSTYLPNTWFFALITPIALYFFSLKLELLEMTTWDYRVPLLAMLLTYLPVAYYFQSFSEKTSLQKRLFVFSILTIIVIGVIAKLAKPALPAMLLANTGMFVPLALSLVFIAYNAHEIIRALLWLVIRAAAGTDKTPYHFLVLCLVYLLNLLYAYFYYTKTIDWDIYFLQPLAILPITIILGVWGFKQRETQYGNLLDFKPQGALLYNSLAIITLATASYAFATGNDPMTEVIEDGIMLTHFGFGFGFMLYVASNFTALLMQNKDVHKVVYKPYRLDFIWVLAVGTLITGAALLRYDFFTFQQAAAGYYNGLGDYYRASGDLKLSEFNYQRAIDYEFQNHKSNYSLATLAKQQGDNETALFHYEKALLKQATPYAYANVATMYLENKKLFDAILKLRAGMEKFPKNGELANNMALVFSQTDVQDSVIYYLGRAKHLAKDENIPEANLFALLTKIKNSKDTDELRKELKINNSVDVIANELVYYNVNKKRFPQSLQPEYVQDSLLQLENLCYLYNYTLNKIGDNDTTMLKLMKDFSKREANIEYVRYLDLAAAFKNRELGNGKMAFHFFEKANDDAYDFDFHKAKLLGMYLFENEQFLQAASYFRKTYYKGFVQGRVYEALALSELDNKSKAIEIWQELTVRQEPEVRFLAHTKLRNLVLDSLKRFDSKTATDNQKYDFLHYNMTNVDDEKFNTVFNAIENPDIRFRIATERVRYYLKMNNLAATESLRNSITGLATNKAELLEELRLLDLALLAKLKRYDDMKKLADEAKFKGLQIGYKTYYQALAADAKNDTLQAEKLFKLALIQIPLEPEVVTSFAQHYNKRNRTLDAYNLLIDNLQLYPEVQYYPPTVYEMYILQALEINFTQDAENALSNLFNLVSKQEYDIFYKIFQQRKKEIEKMTEGWN
jgi:hypothetical protein